MRPLAAVLLCALAAGCSLGSRDEPEPVAAGGSAVTPEQLVEAVTVERLVRHLRELQAIADRNGGTRETGSRGYDESVAYVVRELREAGYEPRLHRFRFPGSRDVRPPVLEQVAPAGGPFEHEQDFLTLRYSGSGDVTARVRAVDAAGSRSGCERTDFDGFPRGAIALLRRGGCFFFVKARNAEAAGAAAVLVFNEEAAGPDGPIGATLGRPAARVPVLGLTNDLGERLVRATEGGALTMRAAANVSNEEIEAANVVADLPGRREGGAVLLGAHLDSVANGPGINDNGSGTAAVLETAIELGRLGARPSRGLRFTFWAAEELGLQGSRAYARELGGDARDEIALVLNFDMLASPRFARLVYDADEEIEQAFFDWFESQGLSARPIMLEGRSDHAPFAELAIPVGGLFAGAEGHDPCYHQACDTLANVNRKALGQMADAAAAVAFRLANP